MGSAAAVLSMSNAISPAGIRPHEDYASRSETQYQLHMPLSSPEPKTNSDHKSVQVAPWTRTPAFPIEKLSGSLPHANVAANVDHTAVVLSCLKNLSQFNPNAFTEDAIWRDVYALTGTVRTFNGRDHIKAVWPELSDFHRQSDFAVIPNSSKVIRLDDNVSWISARYSFKTSGEPETLCSGQIGIVPSSSGWKIWLVTTILEELKGFPNPDYIKSQGQNETTNDTNGASNPTDFDCVVIGAGFAGLCLGGRLKAMGVRSVILERNDHVGDNWTNRYDSARFHTTKPYSEMPHGGIFKKEDDYFLPGTALARGYREYAEKHALNVWLSTNLKSASFNKETEIWTLHIDHEGHLSTIQAPHFVLAIGAGGTIPKMPDYPNRDQYKGEVLHSVDYKSAHKWKGKVGIVVGTANTAHDVAEDMIDAGLTSITMIQRGRTAVFPIDYFRQWSDAVYNDKIPLEEADRATMATPIAITRQLSIFGHNKLAAKDPERFDALERVGFRVDRFGDLWKLLSERLGGHYMDVGCSKKIAAGLIDVKGDAAIVGYTPTGLRFSDGSKLDADVIVFCTGFEHDVRKEATKIVGPVVGEKLDDYWDLDDEGELRGVYKPMGYPGIWYTGGGVTYARFYSRFLALQIAADTSGTPLKLYRGKPWA